ncbi:hypothetical protein B0F90DRAFT_1682232 [Multifurca ochricompacta]|uniref:RING-type domain-containing protein n=1 Tax=Multifurca ochricompacta TaxID=376703 RepID=A0AAD4QUL9_9AGAM|nr:hypothetical protein B0F90DRAFT_1682232 [Multifurca ochricompacta]
MAAQSTTHSSNLPTPKRVAKSTSTQSLNHLLNFSLPPRQTHQVQSVWNKERFVNAQYRFVMNPLGDYTVHFADPDIFFQWQDILQIVIPLSSALAAAAAGGGDNPSHSEGHTTCPICLSPPTAPRMTKCGHVFCFPCILHYLGTSDNPKWARCPICFDSVNEKQLKSVHWFTPPPHSDDYLDDVRPRPSSSSVSADVNPTETLKPGSTLRMRLMQRPQITTLALPRSHTWPSDLLPPHQAPFHFLPDVYTYAKFMLATPSYLIENLMRDLSELAAERLTLLELNDTLGIAFCDAAEQKLHAQIAKATALNTEVLHAAIDRALQMEWDITANAALQSQRKQEREGAPTPDLSDAPIHYLSTQIDHLPAPSPTPISRGPKLRKNLNPPPPSTSAYYYYQAASGQPIFLHPLDIRILSGHFGAYAEFPDSISVRVEAASEGSVDADLRRRCKYLSHIPEGADVVFIEADLEGVVSGDGLRAFEGAIKARRSRRREKSRRDERARIRAEEREREKLSDAGVGAGTVWAPSETTMTTVGSRAWGHDEHEHNDVEFERESATLVPPSPTQALQPQTARQQQQQGGAWGPRSFAAAANAGPGRAVATGGAGRTPVVAATRATRQQRLQLRYSHDHGYDHDDDTGGDARYDDEGSFGLDLDRAWHEFELQRGPSGGGAGGGDGGGGPGTTNTGRRRRARMVVLGGGGGTHAASRRR